MLNFRPKSIGESSKVSTTEPRRHKESIMHQYPRQGSEEHENPMNNITPSTPMLQLIMRCSGFHQANIEKNWRYASVSNQVRPKHM